MSSYQKYFVENELYINNRKFKYFLSPLLLKNNFKHGFFTKTSSEVNLSLLTNCQNQNQNFILKQIHSNKIIFCSNALLENRHEADGIFCDRSKRNLWIYTADCMPILFADKTKRFVAAIHCGRKGLENKIIKNTIKFFANFGTTKEDLLVAIGPSISKRNYLIDKKTFLNFYKKNSLEEPNYSINLRNSYYSNNFSKLKNQSLIPLDLKDIAHTQLLNEKIPDLNIDISTLCTYESKNDFYSWRRSKTASRQWSFISN